MEKKEKWRRIADALQGKTVVREDNEYPKVPLRKMVQTLSRMTEEEWGIYAFSREPLEGKFGRKEKIEYTKKAAACGREWANKISKEYGTKDPGILAERMGLQVKMPSLPVGGGHVIFAQFVQPDEITIFTKCLDQGEKIQKESECSLLERNTLKNILLAHELFHAVEERHEEEIFTRTEKIELWRKPFSNRSSIVCLSEIAGMEFARELMNLSVSPYILDVLLVYAFDKEKAWGLYDEICSLTESGKSQASNA